VYFEQESEGQHQDKALLERYKSATLNGESVSAPKYTEPKARDFGAPKSPPRL